LQRHDINRLPGGRKTRVQAMKDRHNPDPGGSAHRLVTLWNVTPVDADAISATMRSCGEHQEQQCCQPHQQAQTARPDPFSPVRYLQHLIHAVGLAQSP